MARDSDGDRSLDELRERVAELEAQLSGGPTRRQVIAGGGLLGLGGLLGGGATGNASAQAAGQVGTESAPVDVEAANVNSGSVNAEQELKAPVYTDNANAVQENRSLWYNDGSGPNASGYYSYDNGTVTGPFGEGGSASQWEELELDTGAIDADNNYQQAPKIVRASNDDLVVVKREGDVHTVDSSGRLIAQIFAGGSWSSKIEVVNSSGDDRNPSIVYDDASGRITVLYRSYDSNGNLEGIFQVESEDDGQSWSSRTDISSAFQYSAVAAFGGYVETSNGLMTVAITEDGNGDRHMEAIFSTDGGQTWGSPVSIIDETVTGFALSEPVPCRVTDDKLLCSIRDDRRDGSADGWVVVTSADGGSTWDSNNYTAVNPFNNGYPAYFHLKQTSPGQLVGACGSRLDDTTALADDMYLLRAPAHEVWKDPTILDTDSDITRFASPYADDGSDWGYPTFVKAGPSTESIVLVWMDDETQDDTPNVWASSAGYGDTEFGGSSTSSTPTTTNVRAELGADQTVPTDTFTKVELDTVNFGSNFNTVDNQYEAPADGVYSIGAQVHPRGDISEGNRFIVRLQKNGTTTINRVDDAQGKTGGGSLTIAVSDVQELTAGDAIALECFHEEGVDIDLNSGERTNMRVFKIE